MSFISKLFTWGSDTPEVKIVEDTKKEEAPKRLLHIPELESGMLDGWPKSEEYHCLGMLHYWSYGSDRYNHDVGKLTNFTKDNYKEWLRDWKTLLHILVARQKEYKTIMRNPENHKQIPSKWPGITYAVASAAQSKAAQNAQFITNLLQLRRIGKEKIKSLVVES